MRRWSCSTMLLGYCSRLHPVPRRRASLARAEIGRDGLEVLFFQQSPKATRLGRGDREASSACAWSRVAVAWRDWSVAAAILACRSARDPEACCTLGQLGLEAFFRGGDLPDLLARFLVLRSAVEFGVDKTAPSRGLRLLLSQSEWVGCRPVLG